MKKRLLSILLTLCMALSLLPAAAFAEGGAKAIQSGTGSIHSYDTSAGGYSYIYYGTWRNSPIKWRVLDTKANTGEADALFLLTDECLYPLPGDLYACYIQFNPANKPNRHLWKDSTLQDWFKNTFYSGANSAFTSAERALIPATTQASSVYLYKEPNAPSYNPPMRFQICALEAEYVFAPSIQDVVNADYGFIDPESRIAGPSNSLGPGTRYWLRSFEISEQLPFMVGENASLMGDWGDNPSAVRPAMNLSTAGDNILFISAAEGGKPSGGLTEIGEYAGNEWKLTLLDSSRSGFSVTTANLSAYTRGGTVKIGYTGAKTGTNEYVSAMILDAAGAPAYYGRSSAALTDENGTAELTIPALAEGTYTLKVFNEQYNGDKMTDLASAFADVTLTVEEGVEEQFSLTPGGRYYFDLSAMNIPGTANDELPDSTLHYVPFTYTGTVYAYSLSSNSSGVASSSQAASIAVSSSAQYGYARDHSLFIADYAVAHSVSWHDLNAASLIFGKDYDSGNISYALRAPSVGSKHKSASDADEHGNPENNEWDAILNKARQDWQDNTTGYIKNWNEMYSTGQDTAELPSTGTSHRMKRGYTSVRCLNHSNAGTALPYDGFRPILEVLHADTLGSDALKTVALDLNGGSIGDATGTVNIVVKNGESFTAPSGEGLTRPKGNTDSYFWWLGSDGESYVPGAMIPAGVASLTAQWTALTYSVTLHENGGTISSGNVTSYNYGEGATLPAADNTTREGYTFAGWYDNEVLTGNPITEISTDETGNRTYWAKWTINQYTITFDTDGGSAIAPITQNYGTLITAPENPSKLGYTFAGWNPAIPATMPAEDQTLTAQWSCDTYAITYDLNGGTASGNPDSYTVESGEITLNAPEKSGYTFTGWSGTDLTGEDNLTVTILTGSTGDRSYTAHWSLNTYSITYDLNGGTATGNPDSYTVESEAITLNAPEKTGYTFTGWSGTDLTGEENLTVVIPTGSTGNRSYTAHWSLNTYSITYDLNGGTASGNPTSYTVESAAITLNQPTKTGYTFTGWSGTDLTGEDNLTVTIPTGSIGNRSYTAHWSLNTYSITYDLDGGTAFGNPDSYTVESAAITLNEPTKAGYVFTGWSGTDLVGEDNLTVTIPAGSIGDRRYTAHWEFDPTIIAALNPTPNVDFLDVSRTDWFYYDVRYVCENGLMNGTSRNRFSPYGTATRGMLVTILYRMENEPRCFGSAAFSDVKPGAYYEKAVVWASQNNIVSGYTDGTFRPDAPVTREQLASILYRYTLYRGQDVSAGETTSLTGYGDAQTVSNYALPAMRWACGTGFLQGANGKLNPSGLATRAQLAAMLHRYLTK